MTPLKHPVCVPLEVYARSVCAPQLQIPAALVVKTRSSADAGVEVEVGAGQGQASLLIGREGKTATAVRRLIVGAARAMGYSGAISVRVVDGRDPR